MKQYDYIVEHGDNGSLLQHKLDEFSAIGYRLHTLQIDHSGWMIVMERSVA